MQMLLLLLVKCMIIVSVSSCIAALLLRYITRMPRFAGFFITCCETATWSFFIITGFGAVLNSVLCRYLTIACYFAGSIPGISSLSNAQFLFLDSSWYMIIVFTFAMTVTQWFMLRNYYRLSDDIILALLGISSASASLIWYACLKSIT